MNYVSRLTAVFFVCVAMTWIADTPAYSQQGLPQAHPPLENAAPTGTQVAQSGGNTASGTVIEFIDAAGYTYVNVDAGARTIWAAAPRFPVKVGDRVSVPTDSPMQNYRSDSLDRTFPLVYFAGAIRVVAAGTNAAPRADNAPPHPPISKAPPLPAQSLVGIAKADAGYTVGEVFDSGRGLAGSDVAVRGRVVKFSPGIMGTNWLHIQDGSAGKDGNNDLIVTSDSAAAVGDVVLIRGTVGVDKDFGYGYTYAILVEGASVTVE